MAGNPFKDLTTTEGGYHTWDSDLINVDAVSQTGHGVYVAVLDTGLVPNWKDYFPNARVATNLGTGFDQPVTFRSSSKNNPCGLETEVGNLQQSTWVGSTGSTHGTHVASTILGYTYRSNSDAAGGFPAACHRRARHRAGRDRHSGACALRPPDSSAAQVHRPGPAALDECRVRH
jgi:hypothetical protein